ncbi:hypothetical protein [Streptomyces sp. NPDC001068]|uniref:hypothetical protein n=1 Tax=Streptomyces sp. NPDC001068 TaxID=3364544 RepID=UPI0036A8389C
MQSAADYRQWKTWSAADRKQYGSPFFYRDRQFFIPAASSGVHWFAVAATATGSKDRAFLVFDKVGATYKLVASLYTDKKDPLPSIPVDRDGFVTPADPAKAVGDLAPNQVGAALSDLFATGGKKTGARLAATTASTSARKVYADRGKGKMSGFSTKRFFAKQPVHPEVYALRLAGGSVLAVFPSSHTAETMLKPPYMGSYKINPSDSEAVYDRTGRVVIVDEFQNLGLARLNPGGKAEVITAEYRMVDSR